MRSTAAEVAVGLIMDDSGSVWVALWICRGGARACRRARRSPGARKRSQRDIVAMDLEATASENCAHVDTRSSLFLRGLMPECLSALPRISESELFSLWSELWSWTLDVTPELYFTSTLHDHTLLIPETIIASKSIVPFPLSNLKALAQTLPKLIEH